MTNKEIENGVVPKLFLSSLHGKSASNTDSNNCNLTDRKADKMNKEIENGVVPKIIEDKYTGCWDCKYVNDSEYLCVLRQCVHALKPKECFERNRSVGKWVTITEIGQQEVCSNCGEIRFRKGQIYCGHCGSKNLIKE